MDLVQLPDHLTDPQVRRVALLSVHTSPLDQPGTGDGGGLNVYVIEVARRLAARGVAVDIYTRATDPHQPAAQVLAPGLTVHRIVAGPPADVPKHELTNSLCAFVMAMLRHPTAGSHDVVHSHYWLSGWVGRRLAERWGIPFVHTFHTLGLLKNSALAPGDVPEPPLRLAAEQRIADAADRVLALTCGEARLLHRRFGMSGSRIAVVPAGVDLERFHARPQPSDVRLAGDLIAGEGPLILFVGRLQPLKGPDLAIRSLAHVRETLPDARLLIVGGTSGSGRGRTGPEELLALADELGVSDAVALAPAQDQDRLASLYRAADVVHVPSRTETFGLVALEAQACGTPVVAARVGGLEAVVSGGTLVDGHDPVAHAEALIHLLASPDARTAAAEEGVRRAEAASWDRTVDRLMAVYGALRAQLQTVAS